MTQQMDRPGEGTPALPPAILGIRQERRDAAENRRRVLTAARQLFEEHGVEAVSMHQIAQQAGVGQGTLYRRYPHKGELCRDLLSDTAERLQNEVDEYLERSKSTTPALERLDGVLTAYVELMETKVPLLAAIGDACWGLRRAEKFQTAGYVWLHGTVAGLLAEAVAGRELRELDPTFTADALLAALSPDIYEFHRQKRGMTPKQILECVRRIIAVESPLVAAGR